ncbi:hypothetical protein [Pseudomonas sp.]|uniref:hypothetical protein n=1 Tax=Pseudomonas sp. TaxID=306 RepID=UPI003D0ECA36
MIVAALSASLYFLLQTANKVALEAYGLDPASFSGSVVEIIGAGVASMFVFSLLLLAFCLLFGRPLVRVLSWLGRLYVARFGTPGSLTRLEGWITSDPAKRPDRVFTVIGPVMLILIAVCIHQSGSAIGLWRVSEAEWLVAANKCASGCFAYTQEGRHDIIIGRPIAANSTYLAIVVGRHKAAKIDVAKLTTAEAHEGKPMVMPPSAPWKLRVGWWVLDMLNANW